MSEEKKINRKGHSREQEGKKTIKMTPDYEFVCVNVYVCVLEEKNWKVK